MQQNTTFMTAEYKYNLGSYASLVHICDFLAFLRF